MAGNDNELRGEVDLSSYFTKEGDLIKGLETQLSLYQAIQDSIERTRKAEQERNTDANIYAEILEDQQREISRQAAIEREQRKERLALEIKIGQLQQKRLNEQGREQRQTDREIKSLQAKLRLTQQAERAEALIKKYHDEDREAARKQSQEVRETGATLMKEGLQGLNPREFLEGLRT